jgi:hypothetical protein
MNQTVLFLPVQRASRMPLTAGQSLVLVALLAGAATGFLATSATATAHAVTVSGADFARLLRAMALIKCAMALAAAAGILWRLSTPASLPWLGAYVVGCFAMAAGPGLIWGMVHVGAGALLLHAGLLASLVLIWRDPAVALRLDGMIQRRRAALRR